MDIVDIVGKFPIEIVVRETVAEILAAIDIGISEVERLRYSVFLDFIRSNLKSEFDEDSKEKYGEFVDLFSRKISHEYSYDRRFIFLLWGLVVRKRWMDGPE
ncbi:hypothetical protein EN925_34750, partial [Mesorhizobium sp. M7A.F.Ca.US.006.04.2.1]